MSLADLTKEGSPQVGYLHAPVTIIDFSDFQCYMCARYEIQSQKLTKHKFRLIS